MATTPALNSMGSPMSHPGISLRRAAVTAGFGVLIMAVAAPFAYVYVWPTLVIPGQIEQTVQNITAHQGLFKAGLVGFLITFLCDVLVAWALYHLLAPINRAVSLLAAWFQVVYAAIALSALSNVVTAYRLVRTSDHLSVIGSDQLHAQVQLLLKTFMYEWGLGMLLFAIHLGLVGYLVYRSGYIPKILGVLLSAASVGYVIGELNPYLFPGVDLEFIVITSGIVELVFMLWLLIGGWKIPEPAV